MNDVMGELWGVLESRKKGNRPGSYTVELLAAGNEEISKKVGEEAIEVIIAAHSQGQQRLIEESADLIYHLLVLLLNNNVTWEEVLTELAKR